VKSALKALEFDVKINRLPRVGTLLIASAAPSRACRTEWCKQTYEASASAVANERPRGPSGKI